MVCVIRRQPSANTASYASNDNYVGVPDCICLQACVHHYSVKRVSMPLRQAKKGLLICSPADPPGSLCAGVGAV